MKNLSQAGRPMLALNAFTHALRAQCAEGPVLVKLRNKTLARVAFIPGNLEDRHAYHDSEGGFEDPETARYWTADGSSISSNELDIVELMQVTPAGATAALEYLEGLRAQWAALLPGA